jgi:hypothetical protein
MSYARKLELFQKSLNRGPMIAPSLDAQTAMNGYAGAIGLAMKWSKTTGQLESSTCSPCNLDVLKAGHKAGPEFYEDTYIRRNQVYSIIGGGMTTLDSNSYITDLEQQIKHLESLMHQLSEEKVTTMIEDDLTLMEELLAQILELEKKRDELIEDLNIAQYEKRLESGESLEGEDEQSEQIEF